MGLGCGVPAGIASVSLPAGHSVASGKNGVDDLLGPKVADIGVHAVEHVVADLQVDKAAAAAADGQPLLLEILQDITGYRKIFKGGRPGPQVEPHRGEVVGGIRVVGRSR